MHRKMVQSDWLRADLKIKNRTITNQSRAITCNGAGGKQTNWQTGLPSALMGSFKVANRNEQIQIL